MPETALAVQDQEFVVSSFRLSPTGLSPIGEPSIDQWQEVGEFIRHSSKAVHFWIGDWLNFGESAWGERYTQALDETHYDYQTLRNDKWVTSRIPPERRVPELSFTHHKEVADLPSDEQDELLAIARDQGLNYEKFRKVVKTRGLALEDQTLSPHGDKSPVQALIDSLLTTERLVTRLPVNDLTLEEVQALGKMTRDLEQTLERFLIKLTSHEKDVSNDPSA